MDHTTRHVRDTALFYQDHGQTQGLLVESLEWYDWLETASTFTFESSHGSFTARKERAGNKRGGWYWKAYRRRGGKLLSAYIGKLESLTIERLHSVAAQLNRENGLTSSQVIYANTPGGFSLPALATAAPARVYHG